MLLESLARSAATADSDTERGCVRQRVHWRLDLDPHGAPVGPVVRIGDGPGGVDLDIPGRKRSGTKPPPLLLDKGDYTLGVAAKGGDREQARAKERHESWAELVMSAGQSIDDTGLLALCAFARSTHPVQLPEDFNAAQFLAVYVSGRLPTDNPDVRQWWREHLEPGAETEIVRDQCAVCGQMGEIVEFVPVAIRGLNRISGSADMALVSANQNSFEHHGLARAASARVCRSCGEATHQRLNALIHSEQNRRFHDDVVLLWWANEEAPDLMTALFDGTRPEDVAHLLSGPWKGPQATLGDPGRFDAVVLGASKARVVVRSWVSETLGEANTNLGDWFTDVAIVERATGEPIVPGIRLLSDSLKPPGTATTAGPDIPTTLFTCALQGSRLPDLIAQATLRRIGTQGQITYPRASLLRCWLTRRGTTMTQSLDATNSDPAYSAGRLFALLDEAAHAATGTNLIDRFYAQLSAHPGLVVGRLVELHQHHLAKLRRDRPAQAGRIQREVEAALAGVDRFPAHLDLEGRSRFALGLYHQQAADRARRAAYSEPHTETPSPEEDQA